MSVMIDLEFLSRTFRVRYGDQIGSALYVRINNIDLFLTAAHLAEGMQDGDRLGIRYKADWQTIPTVAISRCKIGTDVCAIRPAKSLGEGLLEDQLTAPIAQGEEVAYCGFPLGMEMKSIPGALGWPSGFVKGATFSGAVERPDGSSEFLFDTINNRGFSGGPIVKRHNGRLRVIALVSGYRFDASAPVFQRRSDGKMVEVPDYYVLPNSGFMVGIPVMRAINAARSLV
jgi:hypothetical protein